MESRCASYLYHLIHAHPFRRMPISPNRSPSLNDISNGSPHLIRLEHHHRRWRRRHLLSAATCRLQNGVPSECAEVVEVYSAWTATSLDDPYHATNQSNILDVRRAARVRDRRSPRRNMQPIGRFPGGFVIVGYLTQTMSHLLDTTDPMKRIENSWTSSIPSAFFLLRPQDVPDRFSQVSA
jgi:hypothetical protein